MLVILLLLIELSCFQIIFPSLKCILECMKNNNIYKKCSFLYKNDEKQTDLRDKSQIPRSKLRGIKLAAQQSWG